MRDGRHARRCARRYSGGCAPTRVVDARPAPVLARLSPTLRATALRAAHVPADDLDGLGQALDVDIGGKPDDAAVAGAKLPVALIVL